MFPMRVQKLEVRPTHEPTLTRPCGHPLPSDPGYAGGFAEASGRGAGGEGSFSLEVHGPNARARHVQVEALQVQGSAIIDRRYSLCIFSLACAQRLWC